jgi:hypothetical protein
MEGFMDAPSSFYKEKQDAMVAALAVRPKTLARDECDARVIIGKCGKIFADSNGAYTLYVATGSSRGWTAAKAKLAFCTVTTDCHNEGVLTFDGLPTPQQAAVIRQVLGIRKRRVDGPEALEALKARGSKTRFGTRNRNRRGGDPPISS